MSDFVATHYGWFGVAPVLVDMRNPDAPGLSARWWWAEPLLTVSEWMQGAVIAVLSAIDDNYEPSWMIKLSGRIEGEGGEK